MLPCFQSPHRKNVIQNVSWELSQSAINSTQLLQNWLVKSKHKIDYLPENLVFDENGSANIRVRVHVMNIYNIDTVQQCFNAKIWVQFKWSVQSSYDDINITEPGNTAWYPQFEVLNNIGKVTTDIKMNKVSRGPQTTDLYCRTIIQGTFAEHFELQQFPIDSEMLHVRLVFWQSPFSARRHWPTKNDLPVEIDYPKRIAFYQLPGKNILYMEAFTQRDTWKLDPEVSIRRSKTPAERNDDGVRFPCLDICTKVNRRVGFYIYNVMVPVFILVTMSFISFVIDIHNLTERLTITLTLMLTLVALKFVVTQYLPTTSYLTYMDKYILNSFFYVSMTAGQNVLLFWLGEDFEEDDAHGRKSLRIANQVTGRFLVFSWIFLHMLILLFLAKPIRRKLVQSGETPWDSCEIEFNLPEERPSHDANTNGENDDAVSICY